MTVVAEPLRAVWQAHSGGVLAHIAVIGGALSALGEGRLGEAEREQAQRAAHMLAGSLGTFGFVRASPVAAALDRALKRATASDAPDLKTLLATLHEEVLDDD